MSEDLSEGEKGDVVVDLSSHGESNRGRLPRISSVDALETWTSQQKGKKLYIVLIRYDVKPLLLLFVIKRDPNINDLLSVLIWYRKRDDFNCPLENF